MESQPIAIDYTWQLQSLVNTLQSARLTVQNGSKVGNIIIRVDQEQKILDLIDILLKKIEEQLNGSNS